MQHKMLVLALIIMTAVGCGTRRNGGGASSAAPPNNGSPVSTPGTDPAALHQRGYLGRSSGMVMFVQLVDDNGRLSGQFQQAQTDTAAAVSSQNYPFTGSHSGKNVSITLTGSVWTTGWNTKTLTGTLSGNELTLVFPNDNGTLGTVVFKDATVDDYNQAVTGIQQAATQQLRAEQAAQAAAKAAQDAIDERARQQRAVATANNEMAGALRTLADDAGGLGDAAGFEDVFKGQQRTLDEMKAQFADIQKKAAQRPTCYERDQLGYEVDQIGYNLDQIGYQRDQAGYIRDQVNDRISTAKGDILTLQRAWVQLQAAAQANITGTPTPAYTADGFQAALTAANGKVAAASASVQQSLSKASDFVNQGKALLATAKEFMTHVRCSG